ncbi:peptidoglycan-binding domain-containing protein [Streptomyces sp. NPDC033538]|uniref:peptidoglycan-binding domain-containing protein n=1 Tax=Streptomyces sp. NPDC033538 TaxID=3155367 RepID=UPI0033D4AA6A
MRIRLKIGSAAVALGAVAALVSSANSAPVAGETELGRVLPVAGTCPYSGSHPELTRSDSYSSAVKHAQCLWNTQNDLHSGRKLINQDGYFGADTYKAMRLIQSACGITVDGIVGPDTWRCLHPDQSPNPKYKPGVWPAD